MDVRCQVFVIQDAENRFPLEPGQGSATLLRAFIGPYAFNRSSCLSLRRKNDPAKARELSEMSSKRSRDRGTSSIQSRVTAKQ
jgi:hypothetical protein